MGRPRKEPVVETLAPMQDPLVEGSEDTAPAETVVETPILEREESKGLLAKPLTKAEITDIQNRAADQVKKEIKKAERQKLFDEEVARLRAENGVGKPTDLPQHLNEIVSLRIDLSDNDGTADAYIALDGKKFYHGRTYEIPRHMANDINWIMYRNRLTNLSKDGKSVFRNRDYRSSISGKGMESVH